ncbi:MAG: 5-formyltetrahydrofolate cyclo-ligase [Candidatus Gracilibacteria bacterium]|jgi:5-formyltetrahydrofolate cyclo-ligase|nr:5-formyltetrahydrofolate cyclo-ligase [Candidatus Gracilibacteria bacterium]
MSKKDLRKHAHNQRSLLNKEGRRRKSEKICKLIEESDFFAQAKCVSCFAAFGEEVDLFPLIERYINKKSFCLPFVNNLEKGDMDMYEIDSVYNLKKNIIKIPEPDISICKKINPREIDLIIVPALLIDKNFFRMGHGRGFYDRYLPKTRAFSVAVAFSSQIVDKIPVYPHDVSVDAVCTENGIIIKKQFN